MHVLLGVAGDARSRAAGAATPALVGTAADEELAAVGASQKASPLLQPAAAASTMVAWATRARSSSTGSSLPGTCASVLPGRSPSTRSSETAQLAGYHWAFAGAALLALGAALATQLVLRHGPARGRALTPRGSSG